MGTFYRFVVARWAWLVAICLTWACGPRLLFRPLDLEVQGLSSRAERLVVLVFPEETGQRCAELSLEGAPALTAPISFVWERSSEAPRQAEFPDIEGMTVTVVAYSEDASGTPIQFACDEIDYADVESPEITLTLSARNASLRSRAPIRYAHLLAAKHDGFCL